MAIPNGLYPRRCLFMPHSKGLANGDYNKCEMMAPLGKKLGGRELFTVPDERLIYSWFECRLFLWREIWQGYAHQESWLLHDGEK